jgi:hypothetical protein
MIKWKKVKGEFGEGVAEGKSGTFTFRVGDSPGGWWVLVWQEGAGYSHIYDKYSLASQDAAKKHAHEFLLKVLLGG